MSYRYYIGMISNKRLKEIKNVANYKELHEKIYPEKPYNDNKDEYVGVYDIQELSLHEFGSGADYLQNMPKKSQKKIFLNKEFNENVTAEHTFYLTNKDGLLHIIESLRKVMESYYQKMWALSVFLEVLQITDLKKIKEWEKGFANACEFIFTNEYNRYKWELSDINITLEELFKDSNKEIRDRALKYISAEMLSYFRGELNEYQTNYKMNFYNLDENKPFKIVNSWRIDKAILELVHILKTFNFKKNKLVIYGY